MKQGFIFVLLSAMLVGCGQEKVRTYQTPKESPAVPVAVQPSGNGFAATLPEGWTEKPGSGMRMLSYAIAGSDIDFYLISLQMGDVPSNVNRWRGQVGLASLSPEAVAKQVESFRVGGHEAKYIEIYNEKNGKGIVAAIVERTPEYWYFTAKGSLGELKGHSTEIRAFLESVKLEGHGR